MLCLFQNLVLNIFYFCYFTPSVNHNLSLFSKLKWWFWSTPTFCKLLTLVSQLKQLKITFCLTISNISLRALQHQVLFPFFIFFFFFLSLPNLTRFLFSLQRPLTAASSHLSLSFWRLTLTRHSISSQANISVQCLILQFSSQIPFYSSPPSSVPMVPTQPTTVQRAVWRGGRGKRGLEKFWEAWKMCRRSLQYLWVPVSTHLLSNRFTVEQEQPLGCCACRVVPTTPLLFILQKQLDLPLFSAEQNFRILDGLACWYLCFSCDCWLYMDHS